LSGGQILQKKRDFRARLNAKAASILDWVLPTMIFGRVPSQSSSSSTTESETTPRRNKQGSAVTSFGADGRSIADIKKDIVFTIDDIATDLSYDEKESLLSESVIVFQKNNEIIGSIEKTGMAALRNLATNIAVVFFLLAIIGYSAYCWYDS